MKFSKSYNPDKRKSHKPPRYSVERMGRERDEVLLLMVRATSETEKNAIINAYHATINP